ncbi:MAG: hypothetical protein WDO12_03435 [Pseudomonadota bacterium]
MKKQTYAMVSIVAAGVLAGCNDSSSTKAQGPDSFTKEVQKVVATSSDTALPASIDSVVAVNADAAVPVAVY